MERLPALKITQASPGRSDSRLDLYVTAMTLVQLKRFSQVDAWGPSNEKGYQRPGTTRRFKQLGKYVREGSGILPTSILLGVRPDGVDRVQREGFEGNAPVLSGNLIIEEGAVLWNVDGQHRIGGMISEYESGTSELGDYPFPVVIMWEVDQYTEMQHFFVINTEQKKMETDIADRLLIQMQDEMGVGLISATGTGENKYIRADTTKVVDQLDSLPGPWQELIQVPGVKGRDRGLVRQHAMVVSLEPFMKESSVRRLPLHRKVETITMYWAALADCCPEAFATPQDYRMQATVGIYSLNRALPAVAQTCQTRGGIKPEILKSVLSEAQGGVFTSQFWHKEDGDNLTLGTGMASIRALTQHIINNLPDDVGELTF